MREQTGTTTRHLHDQVRRPFLSLWMGRYFVAFFELWNQMPFPSSETKPPGTVKTRYFLLYLGRMRVRHFSRGGASLGLWVRARRSTNAKGEKAISCSYRRSEQSIVADAFFKLGQKTSRYSKNKVLFTVPCVCTRETLFLGDVVLLGEQSGTNRGRLRLMGEYSLVTCYGQAIFYVALSTLTGPNLKVQ